MNNLNGLKKHMRFEAFRSSGPGGQNVNKRETAVRAEIRMADIEITLRLSEEQKEKLSKLYPLGAMSAVSRETRYQAKNKELAEQKLLEKIKEAVKIPKKRKLKKKETKAGKEIRLKQKKRISMKKQARRRGTTDNF